MTSVGHHSAATQFFASQKAPLEASHRTNMTTTFSPNLNLYSNYLMNQQAIALSPTQHHHHNNTNANSGLVGPVPNTLLQHNAGNAGNPGNNTSVRLKKMATPQNQTVHHTRTAGSRTRPRLQQQAGVTNLADSGNQQQMN